MDETQENDNFYIRSFTRNHSFINNNEIIESDTEEVNTKNKKKTNNKIKEKTESSYISPLEFHPFQSIHPFYEVYPNLPKDLKNLKNLSSFCIFFQFFSNKQMEMIVKNTNIYAYIHGAIIC